MPELSLAELMRREDSGSTNMRSCWHVGRTELVETTEDWCGLESPTTYPQRSSRHDGFEVLAKSSSSKPSTGGHNSTLFACFRRRSAVHLTEPDLESSTPPRGGMLVMQAPCTSMRSSGNVTTFMEVAAVDPQHGYSGYEFDQAGLHIYSNEEPTSPVVNCIGQVPNGSRCWYDRRRSQSSAAILPRRASQVLQQQQLGITRASRCKGQSCTHCKKLRQLGQVVLHQRCLQETQLNASQLATEAAGAAITSASSVSPR